MAVVVCILGGHDPMSKHERTFIYRSKWCGRRRAYA